MISLKQSVVAIIGLGGLLSLGACATTPSPLKGSFTAVTEDQAQSGQYTGATVRWGGLVVDTTPGKTDTCFRVMGTRLAGNGEPLTGNQSDFEGRFLACAKGFFDPELYARGRHVTFIGTITRIQHEKIGNYDYPYPRIQASVVYLWPRDVVRPYTNVYYMNGWWGPYGTWGWWPWLGAPMPYYRYPDSDDRHRRPPHQHPHSKPAPPAQKPVWPNLQRPKKPRPAGRPLRYGPRFPARTSAPPQHTPSRPEVTPARSVRPTRPNPPETRHHPSTAHHPRQAPL